MSKFAPLAILSSLVSNVFLTPLVVLIASVRSTLNLRKSSLFPIYALLTADLPRVGGQAVMEGVMMRNGDSFGLAARVKEEIIAERKGWNSFLPESVRTRPFLRGVPVLIETLVNGIKALNRSAELQGEAEGEELTKWQLALTLLASFAMAAVLFLVIPHGLSWLMGILGLAGSVQGISFHIWDGLFKTMMLAGYIACVRRIPEIKRVFQYHGAEHKTIHAFETGKPVDLALAAAQSRLHPRCGTTFLLFVIFISILIHTIAVPLLLFFWSPESSIAMHGLTLVFKLLLIFPIAACAYELIRFAGRMRPGLCATLLNTPGMALQRLTTAEPDEKQLEVAIVALKEALGSDSQFDVRTVPYTRA